ncbi:MAG: LLM class flavin-dependent oxidoreductase, partial [Candidatus Dormiibacterota bacterium]
AAEAITIDHASHGRLELALGAAWFEDEHRQLGIEFPTIGERFDRLEDTLEIVIRLSTGDVVSYDGHHFALTDARLRPVPVQRPHPPIWIGGSGPRRTLPIVARYADFWHTSGTPEELARLSARLDELAAEAGRAPSEIGRASSLALSEPDSVVRAHIEALADMGFTYLVCGWPSTGRQRVEDFASAVMVDYDPPSARGRQPDPTLRGFHRGTPQLEDHGLGRVSDTMNLHGSDRPVRLSKQNST